MKTLCFRFPGRRVGAPRPRAAGQAAPSGQTREEASPPQTEPLSPGRQHGPPVGRTPLRSAT